MFDLRYHVASLTAVFVALVIGVLVGVGLSGKGFVNDAERANLTRQIDDLRNERNAAQAALDSASLGARALKEFSDAVYPAVAPGRLPKSRIAVLFAGPIDSRPSLAIGTAVRDAGGRVVRTTSIGVPIDVKAVESALQGQPAFRRLVGPDRLHDLGEALAEEFAAGGKTPLWDALGEIIVQESQGTFAPPADAVVIVRSADPQRGDSKAFLEGVYAGLARSGVPAVGAEASRASPSPVPPFSRAGLSTVEPVDTSAGRLALVLLLAGAESGNYGVGPNAADGVLPAVIPAPGG